MSFGDDLKKYFWFPTDPETNNGTEPKPQTFENSYITPCIDMYEYMEKFQRALDAAGNSSNSFIYIAGWWLGFLEHLPNEFPFDPDPSTSINTPLIDILKEKARAGVDVRVLGWVSFSLACGPQHSVAIPLLGSFVDSVAQSNAGHILLINSYTMASIKAFRDEENLGKCGMLNTIGHPAGAVHIKGAVIGRKDDTTDEIRAVAFTGGLDLAENRWAKPGHIPRPRDWDEATPFFQTWHDVEALIEGPAAQGFYDHFRDMWNENLKRKPQGCLFGNKPILSYLEGTEVVPDRALGDSLIAAPRTGPIHHVQSLRTIPAFNYSWNNIFRPNPPVSYAEEGLFEIRAAWRKAILAAQEYIYIEDQMYFGTEIMSWINEALRNSNNPNLKVILVTSGQPDPNDPDSDDDTQYLREAINLGLLGIGTPHELNASQRERIRFFRVWAETFVVTEGQLTHVTLDDDTALARTNVINENPPDKPPAQPIPEDYFSTIKGILFSPNEQKAWRVIGNPDISVGDPFIYQIDSAAGAPMDNVPFVLLQTLGVTIHAKVTLIDDKWALIGSANVARRSLYSDWEHAVSFMDENEEDVARFRSRLWAEHFNLEDYESVRFSNLNDALGAWAREWGVTLDTPLMPVRNLPSAVVDLAPAYLEQLALPFPEAEISFLARYKLDSVKDLDSRENWGGICLP